MRHYNGFGSNQAFEALNRHDGRLGEIVQTLKETGQYENSTIVVLGDHSSLDEDKIINLNVLFREKGWITEDKKGLIQYEVIAKNCDGSVYVYMKDRKNEKLKPQIKSLLEEFKEKYSCIDSIYSAEQAAELGTDPSCTFMLEAARGYYFLDDNYGPVIRQIQQEEAGNVRHVTLNTHGYLPFKDNYTTVFMAAGKGVKQGIVIDEARLIDEGPTMARLLGLELKGTDGRILHEILDI